MMIIAGIVHAIVGRWTTFDAASLFAVASMVAGPAFLGLGASYFVVKIASLQAKGVDRFD